MDIKTSVDHGTEAVKNTGRQLLEGYKGAMDKVTGAEIARNMEEVQSEMEAVYSAMVIRILALEEARDSAELRIRQAQKRARFAVGIAITAAIAAIIAIVVAVLK